MFESRRSSPRRPSGVAAAAAHAFTLVEVLVVIAVLGVLSTMIVPRLGGAAGPRRLRESARQLLTAARYARDYASAHRAACRLAIDVDGQRYALLCQVDPEHRPGEFGPVADASGRTERLAPPVRFGKVWIEPRRRFDGMPPPEGGITFDPLGQSDAAIVELTDGRQSFCLLTSPSTGRVRLVEGVVAELPGDRQDLDE
jgi:prepilin-type N-terminal cleavage/methylation domain-containing protein